MTSASRKTLGQLLSARRRELNVNQERAAVEGIETSAVTFRKWEKDQVVPGWEWFEPIRAWLDVDELTLVRAIKATHALHDRNDGEDASVDGTRG